MNPVDPSKVYRLFYPQVPAILACTDGSRVYAMPVVSMLSLSSEPPLVGVAASPGHATHRAVVDVGRFSLSWVDASAARSVELLGAGTFKGRDKLRAAGLKHARGRALGVPVIEGAAASLECTLQAREAMGDHDLLVGRVERAEASDDFKGYWRFKDYTPLLYAGTLEGSLTTYRAARGAVRVRRA